MSGTRRVNKDLPRHVAKTPKGSFKYKRRVPPELRTLLARSVWDYSLGSDPTVAVRRAMALTDEHDALIDRFKTSEAREAHNDFRQTAVETFKAAIRDDGAEAWRQTPDTMKQVRSLPAHAERDRLAVFAAHAFGDASYMNRTPVQDPGLTMVLTLDTKPVQRPSDPTDALMYDAFKAALGARLSQIEPADDPAIGMRLTALIAAYSKHNATRPNTVRSYKNKVKLLVDFAQDHPLTHYDAATLRNYRDALIAGTHPVKNPVKPVTVQQYFAPLKALWKWAESEYSELKGLTFPHVSLPKSGETVEDTRWIAFDEDGIKRVWSLVNAAWGEQAKSKVAPERRQAFLMAVRVLLYTGMRPTEVFHLTAGDVRDGVLSIRYTKTKTTRKIPLAAALSDFPDFLAAGGFAAALGKETPTGLAGSMSEGFAKIIRAGGFTNDRHVMYSLKDTLIDRLQRQGASDDVMRGIIGHVTGGGKLRHYKTPFGQSPHGMAAMREALDAITYW